MASLSFHLLRVSEIKEETSDSISIFFEVPAQLRDIFRFLPGQYLTLRRQINGEEVRRSFSISAAPDDGDLRVSVKFLDDGKFSNYARKELKVGDELEVMPPLGRFTPQHQILLNGGKNYIAFAAGSGITPIMSIMKTILKHQPGSTFTLVYGNRTTPDMMFKEDIEGLKNSYINRLVVHYLFTKQSTDADIFNGRITVEKIKEMDQHLFDLTVVDEVFLCGPEQMILSLRDYFIQEKELDIKQVHIELFSSPDQSQDRKEEWKKKASQQQKEEGGDEKCEVEIHIDGSSQTVKLGYADQSILDQGLSEGMNLPYSCKSGVCTTCRAKLLEGEVDMEVNYGLEPEEIKNNYILTCQAHPKTNKVRVDFDV